MKGQKILRERSAEIEAAFQQHKAHIRATRRVSVDPWMRRSCALADAAPGDKDWITVKESERMQAPAGEWKPPKRPGRPPRTTKNRTRVCVCGRKKTPEVEICSGCRLGRKQRKRAA